MTDPTVRTGTEVEIMNHALNTYRVRGETSAFYPAVRHWEVRIQGLHNIVVNVLRRVQFEPVKETH